MIVRSTTQTSTIRRRPASTGGRALATSDSPNVQRPLRCNAIRRHVRRGIDARLAQLLRLEDRRGEPERELQHHQRSDHQRSCLLGSQSNTYFYTYTYSDGGGDRDRHSYGNGNRDSYSYSYANGN